MWAEKNLSEIFSEYGNEISEWAKEIWNGISEFFNDYSKKNLIFKR